MTEASFNVPCAVCPQGKYTSIANQTGCIGCPGGYYIDITRAVSYIASAGGKFGDSSVAGESEDTECKSCPLGKFRPGVGEVTCVDCEACAAGRFRAECGGGPSDEAGGQSCERDYECTGASRLLGSGEAGGVLNGYCHGGVCIGGGNSGRCVDCPAASLRKHRLIGCCLLPVAYCLLPIAYCLLHVTCCMRRTPGRHLRCLCLCLSSHYLPTHRPPPTPTHTHTQTQQQPSQRSPGAAIVNHAGVVAVVGGGAAAASGAGRGCAAAATSCDATTSCLCGFQSRSRSRRCCP